MHLVLEYILINSIPTRVFKVKDIYIDKILLYPKFCYSNIEEFLVLVFLAMEYFELDYQIKSVTKAMDNIL
jgi:hypothetical protein